MQETGKKAERDDPSLLLGGFNIHVFTLQEVREMTTTFSDANFIGKGRLGRVYKGFIQDGLRPGLEAQPVAVKFLDERPIREYLREGILLGEFRHPHLVKLIGYCCEEDHGLLVYEYIPRGTLDNHLLRTSLPWSTRIKIALGAAKGLSFLHEAEKLVIFCPFKGSNILLDSGYNAKLSDFRFAKEIPTNETSIFPLCDMGYTAPEYIMTGNQTLKCDVYGFGIVLLELLTGKRAIDTIGKLKETNFANWALPKLKNHQKLQQIIDPRLKGMYSKEGSHAVASLTYNCLSEMPNSRPTMNIIVATLEALKDYKDDSMARDTCTCL